MTKRDKELLAEFVEKKDLYEKLSSKVYEIISNIIEENSVFTMGLSLRVKEYASLEGKLKKKSGKYKALTDITDLCGARVICYFSDTVDIIANKLSEVFEIDDVNSVDKREQWEANAFGYLSLHYICYFKGEEDYCNIPFEIQIRTVLQHVWAEIEHDLGYKSKFGVPRTIRREFSMLASLLELADKEFVTIRENTIKYNEETHQKIVNGDMEGMPIDFVSLAEFVKYNTLFGKIKEKLVNEAGVEIEYANPDGYIRQFDWLGIRTISDLLDMIEGVFDIACEMMLGTIERYELDITTTNMLLRFCCHGELIRRDYNETLIRQFVSLAFDDERSIDIHVDRILELKSKYAK